VKGRTGLKTNSQIFYYRNGQIREEFKMRDRQRHGVSRTWHKNGQLAEEEPFVNNLPHGVFRQWDESGKLLGEYTMVRGTGLKRYWHENGQLRDESFLVRGKCCGRSRSWLRDGTLTQDSLWIDLINLTDADYNAVLQHNQIPDIRDKKRPILFDSLAYDRRFHRLSIAAWLVKPHPCEARVWLKRNVGEKAFPSLGSFKTRRPTAIKRATDSLMICLYDYLKHRPNAPPSAKCVHACP
jgi:hypothetical protein